MIPVLADAAEYAASHKNQFDRVLMPLPERAKEFLPAAASSVKDSGGIIHYYVHVPQDKFDDPSWITNHLEEVDIGRKNEVQRWKRVREVGPRYIQAVADIKLTQSLAF